MSQAKVDRYKEEKKNRKELIAKEKRNHIINVAIVIVIAVAILGWAGVSVYNGYQNNKELETVYTDLSAIDDYMSGLDAE